MAKCDNCKELTIKTEKCVGVVVPFDWCEKKQDNPYRKIARDCPYFKPKTNADRIRSMTDEELAKALVFYDSDFEAYSHVFEPYLTHPVKEEAEKMCLEWLKSEVEDK